MNTLAALRFCAKWLVLALLTSSALAGEIVPVVRTKTETFANVTLVSRTATHLFIQHSRGMATIKIASLDAETLNQFGIGGGGNVPASTAAAPSKTSAVAATTAAASARCSKMLQSLQKGLPPGLATFIVRSWLVVLALFLGLYLFHCYCAKLLCEKAGGKPGALIWLPVLQSFPLLRAAGMSAWWFLAFLVPVLNLVAPLVWCLNISKVRGKGVLTAILLFLPVTGLFTFLYLAFSSGGRSASDGARPSFKGIELEPLPA